MDWSKRAAWIYEDTSYGEISSKLSNHGIGVVYVDPRSGNAASVISSLQAARLLAGIYVAQSWFPAINAIQFADWTNEQLQRLVPRLSGEAPPCMVDIENHDLNYANAYIVRYRAHQPLRPTSYTCEAFQGGLVPIAEMAKAQFHFYPQCYYGDMSPADAAAVCLEAARDYIPSKVHPFYDGANFPSDARDGCVFTAERLL